MSNKKYLQHYYKRLRYLLSKEFSQLSWKFTQNWKKNKKQKHKLHPQWNQEISVTPNHRLWRPVSDFAKKREVTPSDYRGTSLSLRTQKSRNIKVSKNQDGQGSGGMIIRSQFKKLSFLVLLLTFSPLFLSLPLKKIYSLEKTHQRGSRLRNSRN